MLSRPNHIQAIQRLLKQFPVVAILGPRQVGKTTLSKMLAPKSRRYDLEREDDRAQLQQPIDALQAHKGLVVLDEVQHLPRLFEALRVLADRRPLPARFLVLGSASPELLRQSSETLAGRIAYYELPGLDLAELGSKNLSRLWLRGGFPLAYLAKTEAASLAWRDQFIRTFVERDLPQLGSRVPSATMGRFWRMLANLHAQIWNASEMGRAFGMSDHAMRSYLDLLEGAFAVRLLQPWHENLSKRQIKSPKLYLADSGIYHSLMDIRTAADLQTSPKVGASWEGFAIGQVVRHLGAKDRECYFWRTVAGAELDLLVVRGRERLGFEFKRNNAPMMTPSLRIAKKDLRLKSIQVIHPGGRRYLMAPGVEAVPLKALFQ